ncbi:UNVERIFIED_CONTAM: hypothetical protein RMT77_006418 [Armadillidium vulgare]
MSLSYAYLLGFLCLVYPVLSDPTAVVEDGASSVMGREAKLLDLSKMASKSKIAEFFDFNSKKSSSDSIREDNARARFFNVVKKSSLSPYEMLIDCLILVIPEKIETLQEICENLQILLDLRIQENTIDFDAFSNALMQAMTTFLQTLQQAIQTLQAVAGMAPAPAPAPARRRRPNPAARRRNEIHQMLRQMLRNQQEQLQRQQKSREPKDHNSVKVIN